MDRRIIGGISSKVEKALGLIDIKDRNVYIGETNIRHMLTSHPSDYKKYGSQISEIISSPDYVGINPSDKSIEYVKEFVIEGEFVKVAVRVSASNKFYARSIYVLNNNRVKNFINAGTLKKIN